MNFTYHLSDYSLNIRCNFRKPFTNIITTNYRKNKEVEEFYPVTAI